MQIQSFTRIMARRGSEEWIEKLSRMDRLFHQTEVQMVKKSFKGAAIVQVDTDNLQSFLKKVDKERLVFTILKKMTISSGSSIASKPTEADQSFIWIGCLTQTHKEGQQFKQVYSKNDYQAMGRILGHPKCCINYLIKNIPVDSYPIWVDLQGKITGFPECNGMLRYFGPKIVAHLSCSPVCQATKEIGKIWFKTMQEIDRELANEMYQLLAGPITWNSYHGVVQIETPYFIGLNNATFILKKPRIIVWQAKKETKKERPLK